MRSRTVGIAAAVLMAGVTLSAIAALVGSAGGAPLAAPAARAAALLPELEKCVGSPVGQYDKSEDFDIEVRADAALCAEPLVGQATLDGGVEYGYQVMKNLMKLDPRFDDCHPAAHGIGHAATQVVKDDMQLMQNAFIGCTYGYIDGVVMALSERYTSWSDSRLADLVARLCQSYKLDGEEQNLAVSNSYHGYGHVLSTRHQPMIVNAFRACTFLPSDDLPGFDSASAQCAGGVAMDFATADLTGRQVLPKVKHPQQVCLLVAVNLRKACLNFSAHDDIESRGGPSAYLAWCVSEPGMNAFVTQCAASVGTWGGRTRKVAEAIEACDGLRGLPDGKESQRACGNGVVVSLHESTSKPIVDAVAEFCIRADKVLCQRLDEAVRANVAYSSSPLVPAVSLGAGSTPGP